MEGNIYWGRLKYILVPAVLLFITSCGSTDNGSGGNPTYNPIDTTVVFPATDTSIPLDFDFSITGSGSSLIGDIDINNSQGTIVIDDQTLDTIVYANIPWESAGYNLYQGIAFSDTDLFVYWLYCSISNNSLDRVFYESTDQHEITRESASGACDFQEETSQPSFSLTERNIGINRLVSGYTITGDDILFGGDQAGTLTYFDTTFTLYPFEEVDCSGCSGGEWWELHSIAYDDAGETACFTILYLFADSADNIFSSYSICFPELDNINATLSGTWLSSNITP